MKTFIEWIIKETAAAKFNWYRKYPESWSATFKMDDIDFRMDFYTDSDVAPSNNPNTWNVQIQQVAGHRVVSPQKLDFLRLAQVFQTLDEAMIDFVQQHLKIEEFKIHPITLSSHTARMDKLSKRGEPSEENFDKNKFFAYQQLFQYSSLKQLGFDLKTEGEYIIIYKN